VLACRLVLASIPKGLPIEHVKTSAGQLQSEECHRPTRLRDPVAVGTFLGCEQRSGAAPRIRLRGLRLGTGRLTLARQVTLAELPPTGRCREADRGLPVSDGTQRASTNRCVLFGCTSGRRPALGIAGRGLKIVRGKALAPRDHSHRKGATPVPAHSWNRDAPPRCIRWPRSAKSCGIETPNYRHLCKVILLATHTTLPWPGGIR